MASPRSRGRPYGMLLLLAFAAAAVGVMAVQKLRERRVYNILINEKDREVVALNMRYQREKDLSNELKVKIQDLKAKIESLKNEKFELKSKLLEMQSLTTSLQEKHRALRAEVEEKQKQIEILSRRKGLSRKMYMQLIALRETLKHKEDEIHELKHQNPNMLSENSAGSNKTASFRSNDTVIRSVLDGENSTDRGQEFASKGQKEVQKQSPQDGEGLGQGDQSKGTSGDGASSTQGQSANVEPVNKEGNETLQDVNAGKQTEHARRHAVKQEVNVDAGDKLSLNETSQAAAVIQMPADIRNDTVNPTEKVENGDVKALEKRVTETSQVEANENTRRRQDEMVTLLTSTGQSRQPNISENTTGERQPDHKREDIDRPAEALPSELQNSIKTIKVNQSDIQAVDNRENIEDANAQQHHQKDKSIDSKGLENGEDAHEFRQPEHADDSNGEVQKSNPETEVTKNAEENDDGDAFEESLEDIPEDERKDTEPENYQDDKDGNEVSEM